jgi:arabinofuranosyltransferase
MKLSWASLWLAISLFVVFKGYYITPIAENIFNLDPTQIENGVADERLFYSPNSGLAYLKDAFIEELSMRRWQDFYWPDAPWRLAGQRINAIVDTRQQSVFVLANIGYTGFYAGPKAYIVDTYALAEPLLAHLPVITNAGMHVGHLPRPVPEGYIETLETGRNQLKDPNLALFYTQLSLITKGDLFDPARLNAIWNMNLGHYDTLIDKAYYSKMSLPEKSLPEKYWKIEY